ncbi:glycosyltransferase family 4 protein [Rhodococcus globerulus]|uniref:glycosyltransferase family 4 protein n=1 Tax=Rhodococcus globerulus TaxID=33008 RepID=UPI0039EB0879
MRFTLLAHEVGEYGGQESAIASFVKYANNSGHIIDLISYKVDDQTASLKNVNVKLVPRPKLPFVFRFLWFFIVAPRCVHPSALTLACGAIVRTKTDAVWMHYWHLNHLREVKWVCSYGGNLVRFLNQSIARVVALLAEGFCIRRSYSGVMIAVSDSLAAELKKYYKSADIIVVPNSVKQIESIEEIVWQDDTVLFVGGEWGRKGLLKIAQACQIAAIQVDRKIKLRIAGNGPQSVIREINGLDMVEVEHIKWTSDIGSFMGTGDIFVSASKYETFGMAGHEAMGYGKRMVVTNVHGLGDAVDRAGTGRITTGAVSDIARCIVETLNEVDGAHAHRAKSFAYISHNFSDADLHGKYDEFIHHLESMEAAR